MDLPRAEIRYHGIQAVGVAIVRRADRINTWVRPRAAPLAITALATLCMLAGLDLIAHDFRKMRERKDPAATAAVPAAEVSRKPITLHLGTDASGAENIIELELVPAPRCDVDVQCFLPEPATAPDQLR